MSRRAVSVGTFVADNDGSDFRAVESLEGWYDGAPVRIDLAEKAQQDGAWDARGYRGPRVVTVAGFIEQTSRVAALQVAQELAALTPATLHQLVVDEPGVGLRSAMVRVTTPAVVTWVSPVAFRFVLTVTAPDHVKYGPEAFGQASLAGSTGTGGLTWPLTYPLDWGVPPGVTPGAVTVANNGTASYHPRLRIDGPVTNPLVTLVETGDFVQFNDTIAAGQHLDINWGTPRRVTLGDNPVSVRHLTSSSGNWLAVPVGGGSIAYSADDADPAAVLSVWSYEGAWE